MTQDYLTFTLAAPMASFGDVAGHERRGSRERPGKSAILGLIGAALGIRRDDPGGQNALRSGYDMAVLVLNPGSAMQDFHTAQAISADKKLRPRTRADALNRGKLNTIITRRDYRMDVHYRIAIAAIVQDSKARWPLQDLAAALKCPRFTLYLGRKSCPLSLPLDPVICEAADILQALRMPDSRAKASERRRVNNATASSHDGRHYAAFSHDGYAALVQKPNTPPRFERVNDDPIDRVSWHFTARQEVVISNIETGDPADNPNQEAQQ